MKQMPQRLLIVEDESVTQRYLRSILQHYGIKDIWCYDNAEDALHTVSKRRFDMILMDINLRGQTDGIALSRQILQHYDIPIVFITAYSDNKTLDQILELSPYGFIPKPFSAKDVIVSIKVAYQRYLTLHEEKPKMQQGEASLIPLAKHYTYDKTNKRLLKDGSFVKLSPNHQKLIEILSDNLNKAVSYEELAKYIWGKHEVSSSTLRTLVYSLRKTLPDLPIVSQNKVGYMIKTR